MSGYVWLASTCVAMCVDCIYIAKQSAQVVPRFSPLMLEALHQIPAAHSPPDSSSALIGRCFGDPGSQLDQKDPTKRLQLVSPMSNSDNPSEPVNCE